MLKQIKTAGEYIKYTGLVLLTMMAVVGTVAIDIVILVAILTESKKNEQRGHENEGHGFFTGYVIGVMFSNHNQSSPLQTTIQLLLSPITTLIAIALSVCLGVPQVGIALAIGWGVAVGVLALGMGISQLAEIGIAYFEQKEASITCASNSLEHENINNSYGSILQHSGSPVATHSSAVPIVIATCIDDAANDSSVANQFSSNRYTSMFFEPSAPPANVSSVYVTNEATSLKQG